MVLATKKNCQRVLAASLRVVSAMTGNPPLGRSGDTLYPRSLEIALGFAVLSSLISRASQHNCPGTSHLLKIKL